MIKRILIIFLVLLSLISCRDTTIDAPEYIVFDIDNWADAFTLYWKKMSNNYIFFERERERSGLDWDDVYEKYHPLFVDLGSFPEGGGLPSSETFDEAYQYFYEIFSSLADGHYEVCFNLAHFGDEKYIFNYTNYIKRTLEKAGVEDKDILRFLRTEDPETLQGEDVYKKYFAIRGENTASIASHMGFDSSLSYEEKEITSTSLGHFPSMIHAKNTRAVAALEKIYGKNDDGIIYLSFDNFNFYVNILDEDFRNQNIVKVYEQFARDLPSANGVVIDLRGNLGGDTRDLRLLWGNFFSGFDLKYATYRRKSGDGRFSYTPWIDLTIKPYGNGGFDKTTPIVVLLNEMSMSCSEMSAMAFIALRDNYGYNVEFVGGHSVGGTGVLTTASDEEYSGGGFGTDVIYPYINTFYTPFGELRSHNATSYEGDGIPLDEYVEFEIDKFTNTSDKRLEKAFEVVKGI